MTHTADTPTGLDLNDKDLLALLTERAQLGRFGLKGAVCLVTGGKGRLGPIWAQALRDAGAHSVVASDTETAMNAGSIFKGVQTLFADIADTKEVSNLVRWLQAYDGRIDVLVNNAGVDSRPVPHYDTRVLQTPTAYDAMAEQMARVNLVGTDRMIRAFGGWMAETGGGSIINIASLYGLVSPDLRYYDHREDGWVKDPLYGATKAGVISLTKYYAAKWATQGVRVNALAPGGIVAPGDGLTAQDPQFVAKYTSRIPMGRMCTPEDLAGPLVFLASKASSFVTGQVIALDGGYLCW